MVILENLSMLLACDIDGGSNKSWSDNSDSDSDSGSLYGYDEGSDTDDDCNAGSEETRSFLCLHFTISTVANQTAGKPKLVFMKANSSPRRRGRQ